MVAGPDGRGVFELLRRGRQIKPAAVLCAFHLIMVAGDEGLVAWEAEAGYGVVKFPQQRAQDCDVLGGERAVMPARAPVRLATAHERVGVFHQRTLAVRLQRLRVAVAEYLRPLGERAPLVATTGALLVELLDELIVLVSRDLSGIAGEPDIVMQSAQVGKFGACDRVREFGERDGKLLNAASARKVIPSPVSIRGCRRTAIQ